MRVALLLSPLTVFACLSARPDSPPEEEVARPTIEEVQEARTPQWMTLPGVVGTGIALCDGTPCIRVFLSAPSSEAERLIPDEVEGYRVELEVTGGVRPR